MPLAKFTSKTGLYIYLLFSFYFLSNLQLAANLYSINVSENVSGEIIISNIINSKFKTNFSQSPISSNNFQIALANSELSDSIELNVNIKEYKDFSSVEISKFNTEILATFDFQKNNDKYSFDMLDGSKYDLGSVDREFLQWMSVFTYIGAVENIKQAKAQAKICQCTDKNNECTVYYPHDDQCSGIGKGGTGPFNVNKIRLLVPCYGTTWIDLKNCCKYHDRSIWCAKATNGFMEIERANENLFTCMASTIAYEITDRSPWWCGGVISGTVFGTSQALVFASVVYASVVVYTGVQMVVQADNHCLYYSGYDKNSCLCGGDVKTLNCYTDEFVCQGSSIDFKIIQNDDNCICDTSIVEFSVYPNVANSKYKWQLDSNMELVSNDTSSKIRVKVKNKSKISVQINQDQCPKVSNISKNIEFGKAKIPEINMLISEMNECLNLENNYFFAIDRKIKDSTFDGLIPSQNICNKEYKMFFDESSDIDKVELRSETKINSWSSENNWFMLESKKSNQEDFNVKLNFIARNSCGESPVQSLNFSFEKECKFVQNEERLLKYPFYREVLYRQNSLIYFYPNPCSDLLNITLLHDNEIVNIQLFDLFGRVLLQKELKQNEILDLSNFAQGIYYLVSYNQKIRKSEILIKSK